MAANISGVQGAATLAILQAGYRAWARYTETAFGQPTFMLESRPEPDIDAVARLQATFLDGVAT